MDMGAALGAFHWRFLAQPAPVPERLIGNDPDFFLDHLLNRWAGNPSALDDSAVAHYAEHFRKPLPLIPGPSPQGEKGEFPLLL